MQTAWPIATPVHLPAHASLLNQVQIYFSGVGPVERCRGPVVAVLKADDAFGELVEVGEVVGAYGFSLQYRYKNVLKPALRANGLPGAPIAHERRRHGGPGG
jgi:hypothetical protein